jgi:outer membrane lipoprotein SlyB
MNPTTRSAVDEPIAAQSVFSRPAALIGGAVALVALTAVATTLAVRSPPANDGAGSSSTPLTAMSPPAAKGNAAAAAAAPAEVPEKTMPPSATNAAPAPRSAATPAPVHVQRGAVKAADASVHATKVCTTCGKVESVSAVQQKGEGTGLGVVGGAVVGGLVGSQIGGGNGKNVATVLGAVGGGVAGNEVEKRARATTVYQVRVRMDDGTLRTVTQDTAPAVGQMVTLEGSTLRMRTPSS